MNPYGVKTKDIYLKGICNGRQRYTYRVLQTIQMKLILLCVWAEWPFWAVLKLL